MDYHHSPKLTSAEISNIWNTVNNDSLIVSVLTHFVHHVDDQDVKLLLNRTLEVAQKHHDEASSIFIKEGIPVPVGFPAEDHTDIHAPRLFTDLFYCDFILNACRFALISHSQGFNMSARHDTLRMFQSFYNESNQLLYDILEMMKHKGIYIRPPYIPYPEQRDRVEGQGFLKGWFGKRRPLLAVEISHLFDNGITNLLGKEMLTGFIQVTKTKEIKDYFDRGRKISTDFIHQAQDLLEDDLIPHSMKWDTNVTKSTQPPFSEQLMLFLICSLNATGIGRYGYSLSMTLRRDLATVYMRFLDQALLYSEDGSNLMIERGWMEQPPTTPDRDWLAGD